MKIEKKARPQTGLILLLIGLLFNLIETWYFGWNMTPGTVHEVWCDMASGLLIYIGIFELISFKITSGKDNDEE